MIPISDDLSEELQSDSQIVRPSVQAWLADARYLDNLKIHTTTHSPNKQMLDRDPLTYLRLDKTDYSAVKSTFRVTITNANPAVFTKSSSPLIPHYLASGTAIILSTTGTLPTGLIAGTTYYIQNPSEFTFNLNTSRNNAIADSQTGRVVTSSAGSGTHTLTYYFSRAKDNGSLALDFSYGKYDYDNYVQSSGNAGNYISTPDSADNSITGDIDIRVKVGLSDWTTASLQTLVAKMQVSATQRSYILYVTSGGNIVLATSPDGTATNQVLGTSTVATGLADFQTKWVRATLDVASGSNRVYNFYLSDDGINWNQLGATVTTAGTTSIYNSTSIVEIGSYLGGTTGLSSGRFYAAEIYRGINGVLENKFDATLFPTSASTTMTASTEEVWTSNTSGLTPSTIVKTALGQVSSTIIQSMPTTDKAIEILEPKRVVDTFNKTNSTTLGAFTTSGSVGSESYVRFNGAAGAYITTPDLASYTASSGGSMEIVARVSLDDWTPTNYMAIVSKRDVGAANFGYMFYVNITNGRLVLQRGVSSTAIETQASTVSPSFTNGETYWVRVVKNYSTGAAVFYTAPNQDEVPTSWTALGSSVAGSTATQYNDTNPLAIGAAFAFGTSSLYTLNGKVYRTQVKIDTVVEAEFDARNFKTVDDVTVEGKENSGADVPLWTLYRLGTSPLTVTLPTYSPNGYSDPDMQYYSWSTSNSKWTISSNNAKYIDAAVNNNMQYINCNIRSLDHFIDFKNDGQLGSMAFVRFVDENNYIAMEQPGPYAIPYIYAVVGGVTTVIAYATGGIGDSISSSNYYRLKADYNNFYFYDMGTSEPTNSSVGTLKCSGYFDDPVFRTDEAKKVGLGFKNATLNYVGYPITSLQFSYDYFAAYGFNYLMGAHLFDGTEYLSSTISTSNTASKYNSINNLRNFSIPFWAKFNNDSTSTTKTIMWFGSGTFVQVAPLRIAYIPDPTNTARGQIQVKIRDTVGYTTLLSGTSTYINSNTLNHICIVKNGTRLSIYLNNVEIAFTTLADNYAMYSLSTAGNTPYVIIGGDHAGLSLGDSDPGYHLLNAYLSEFGIFNYAFSSSEIDALYKGVINSATLPVETSDKYLNGSRVVDMFREETLTWGFTNMLNVSNQVIHTDNNIYCVDPSSLVTDNHCWSTRLESDVDGNFSTYQDSITLAFDAREVNKIQISTGFYMGRIKSFEYTIKLSDLTTYTSTYTQTTNESNIYINLDQTYELIEIKIAPMSTYNAYDYGRIYTINPIWEVDLSDYVISFDIAKVRDNYEASLPIGATAANSGSMALDNTGLVFNMFGDTLYGKYTYPDTTFFISFDHEIRKTQNTENIILASEVYADSWSFDNSSMTVNVSFRDYSKYLQEETVKGYVNLSVTAGRAISEIAMLSGVPQRKIITNNKYTETVFKDNPATFFALNENKEYLDDAYASSNYYPFLDQCAKISLANIAFDMTSGHFDPYLESLNEPGSAIVYSDIVSTQDNVHRINDQSSSSVFRPYEQFSSMHFGSNRVGFYDSLGRWNPIDSGSESWTTEVVHFVRTYPTTTSYETMMFVTSELGNSNYTLGYTVNPLNDLSVMQVDKIQYTWSFYDSVGVAHSMSSNFFSAESSHHVVVKKIGGATNTFELYVDGVIEDSISPNVTVSYAVNSQLAFNGSDDSFFSNFAFYDFALESSKIYQHYIASALSVMPIYKYLYAYESTYWDSMLSIATADLGMFYFDEYGFFNYEYRNMLHEEVFPKYQVSQLGLSDSTNILSGSFTSEIQTNKINVKVNQIDLKSNLIENLWSATDGDSLAITTLTSSLTPSSTKVPVSSVTSPQWDNSGYIKIDDEIMKYKSIDGLSFSNLDRGLFGTEKSWHSSGSKVREAKYYSFTYSSAPALDVRYPLVTNENIDIDYTISSSYNSELVLSANSSNAVNSIIFIQGTNPITEIQDSALLVGIPVAQSVGSELITELSADLETNIRRYRLKELTIDNPYIQSKVVAQIIADHIIGYYAEPVRILSLEITGIPNIQLGDLITINNFADLGIISKDYWVVESSITYDGGIQQSLSLRAYTDTIDPPEFTFASGAAASTSGVRRYTF